MRTLYKILSVIGILVAASKGPGALGKNMVRRSAHKGLSRYL